MIKHNFRRANKYNVGPAANRTRDGIVFDSVKEANYYSQLAVLRQAGDVILFLRQTPFHLPGNTRYVCDFVVFWASGEVEFVDVKGVKTPMYKTKKRMVEDLYGIEITER